MSDVRLKVEGAEQIRLIMAAPIGPPGPTDNADAAAEEARQAAQEARDAAQPLTEQKEAAEAARDAAIEAQGLAEGARDAAEGHATTAGTARDQAVVASAYAMDASLEASGHAAAASSFASAAEGSASSASGSASAAASSASAAQTAQGHAEDARDAAQGYATDAQEAAQATAADRLAVAQDRQAIESEQAARLAAIEDAGDTQVGRVEDEGDTQVQRVAEAGEGRLLSAREFAVLGTHHLIAWDDFGRVEDPLAQAPSGHAWANVNLFGGNPFSSLGGGLATVGTTTAEEYSIAWMDVGTALVAVRGSASAGNTTNRRWGLAAAVEDEHTFLALGWRVGGYVELVQCIDKTLTVLASLQEFDAAHQRAAMRPLSLSVYPKRGGGLLVSGWAYPDVRVSATIEGDAADRFVLATGAGIWCQQGSAYLGPIAIWRVTP